MEMNLKRSFGLSDLEGVLSDVDERMGGAVKVRKKIRVAAMPIYLPRYIKVGCEQFIQQIDAYAASGKPIAEPVDDLSRVVAGYIHDSSTYARDSPLLSKEVIAQKRQNLRDALFILLARHSLKKNGYSEFDCYRKLGEAERVMGLYFSGVLN